MNIKDELQSEVKKIIRDKLTQEMFGENSNKTLLGKSDKEKLEYIDRSVNALSEALFEKGYSCFERTLDEIAWLFTLYYDIIGS